MRELFESLGLNVFSQCANTTGNYEFAIKNDSKSITILARNTTATIRSSYVDPAIGGNFVGLVFGIKWSAKSDIVLYKNASESPFVIESSDGIKSKENFNFQSYGDPGESLPMMSKAWMAGDWNVIATIPFTADRLILKRVFSSQKEQNKKSRQ